MTSGQTSRPSTICCAPRETEIVYVMSLRRTIERRLSGYKTVAVWGAGGLARTAVRYWLPVEKMLAVVDSHEAAQGRSVGPFVSRSPDNFDFSAVDAVIVCASAFLEVENAVRARGFAGPVHFVYELFLDGDGEQPIGDLDALCIDIAATKNDNWFRFILMKPQILVNMTFRFGNWCARRPLLAPIYWLMFFVHQCACLLTSIQLPLGTPIGPGLVFAHYGAIVFTQRARIGAFFTIYHGCTVGTNDSGQGPVIGDFVYQYAGSHVLGECLIGNRSRIGANAVVLDQQCEAGSTLVGIPARVVQR